MTEAAAHREAMALVDEAMVSRAQGDEGTYRERIRAAFRLEKQAAERAFEAGAEPARSVLLRSAATLALDCGEVAQAITLVQKGLRGSPPPALERELQGALLRALFALEGEGREKYLLDGMSALCALHLRPLVAVFANRFGSPAESRRLARATLRRVWAEARGFEWPTILGIASRVAANARRIRAVPDEVDRASGLLAAGGQEGCGPRAAEPRGTGPAAEAALRSLDKADRELLLMGLEGVSLRGICLATGTSSTNVRDRFEAIAQVLPEVFRGEVPVPLDEVATDETVASVPVAMPRDARPRRRS
jgi:hypothetical protein